MKNEHIKQASVAVGSLAKKIAESAINAAVFAFVSKKVTNFLTKQEEKENPKLRIEDSSGKLEEKTKK